MLLIILLLFVSIIQGNNDNNSLKTLLINRLNSRQCPLKQCETRIFNNENIEIISKNIEIEKYNTTYNVQVRRMVRAMTSNGEIVTVPAYINEPHVKSITLNTITYADFSVLTNDIFETSNDGEVSLMKVYGKTILRCDSQNFCVITSLIIPTLNLLCQCMNNDIETLLPPINKNNDQLSFMSVNLWNYNHWSQRLSLLKAELRKYSPDFIAFQEVRALKISERRSHRFQVDDLAKMLPEYQYVYEPAMTFKEGDYELHSEGLAIFSKWPIQLSEGIKLTRDITDGGDFHQRMCLHIKVKLSQKFIHIMSTHLSLSQKARMRTLKEIGLYSESLSDGPIILMGDFNAPANEDTVQQLINNYNFQDTWLTVNKHLNEEQGYTFNSWSMSKRIDLILSKGNIKPQTCQVVGSIYDSTDLPPIGGVSNMNGRLYPSDHRFLYMQAKLI